MTTDTQAPKTAVDDITPLLSTMRKGDPASCHEFIERFREPLFNYLYWLSGDTELAADLFQRTMMAVYSNLGRVRKARDAATWVYRQATQVYLEQGRRQQQHARSSWDHILKGGLHTGPDDRWSQWDDSPGDTEEEPAPHRALVDALKHLNPRERAAILLVAVAGNAPRIAADCLHVSNGRTAKLLLAAFGHLATSLPERPDPEPAEVPKGARVAVRRLLLGLLKPGRARKLAVLLEENEAAQAVEREEDAAWKAIRGLPPMAAPASLVEDTEARLRAGQEAKEVRIATWGFRFMQVTVPIFILIFIAIILLPAISRSRLAARQAAASDNLREIGKALLAYSDHTSGNYLPPMAAADGLWVPDLTALYPRYIEDPVLLVRPSLHDPVLAQAMTAALTQSPPDFETAHRLLARSYVYTGYVLRSAADLETLMATRQTIENLDVTRKIETPSKDFFRLGRGVEMFFTTKYNDPEAAAQTRAALPVMFETFDAAGFGGDPDGANVLYLDGHVEYVRFGTDFPVNPPVRELLQGAR